MALSDLVDMALVREAVGSITESLEDPELLDQIRLDEIVPSRKQLEELAKISAGAAVPLRNLIEELSKSGAALAHKVPLDELVRIAGDAEAADEWREGTQWPDTRQAHDRLIAAAARANGVIAAAPACVTNTSITTDSAHADLFTRIDNAITALAEVRSRAGRVLKQMSLGTQLHASGQQADSVVTSYDHLAHQPSPNESCEVADLSYEAERVARSNRETDTQPSTRNALCVDCGQAWQEPSTNTLPSAFLCEFCNEGTRPAVTCCNYLDLWD